MTRTVRGILDNGLFNSVLGIIQHDISGSRKETNVSPLLNLQYRASDRSLAYLSISQGYKSGGFDARSNKPTTLATGVTGSPGTFEFEDERATTYEFGIKSTSRAAAPKAASRRSTPTTRTCRPAPSTAASASTWATAVPKCAASNSRAAGARSIR